MGIDVLIFGPRSAEPVDTHRHANDPRGVVAYVAPLVETDIVVSFLRSTVHGINANVDGAFQGQALVVHDGEDTPAWGTSASSGVKFTFNSTEKFAPGGGTQSVKIDGASVGDTLLFVNSGGAIALSGRVATTLQIYVESGWMAGDEIAITGYDSVGDVPVGESVLLNEYFTSSAFGVWHPLVIPLGDMLLAEETVDAFQITILAKANQAPVWFLDNFQLELSAGSADFEYVAPPGEIVTLDKLALTIVSDLAEATTVVSGGTVPGLNTKTILGKILDNGIGLFRQQTGSVSGFLPIRTVFDFIQGPLALELEVFEKDGTVTLKMVLNAGGIELDSRLQGKFIGRIQDKLDDWTLFRMQIIGRSRLIDDVRRHPET